MSEQTTPQQASSQANTDAAAAQTAQTQAQTPAAPAAPVEASAPPGAAPSEVTEQSAPPAEQNQPAAVGAPEKYEFKAPEGVELAETTLATFSEVAKQFNLTQDAAQGVLAAMSAKLQEQNSAALQAFYADLGGMPDTWESQVRADKEFGGDKLDENLGLAAKFRDTFGSPELKQLLDKTGLGNHPALVRAFIKAGKSISQDSPVMGSGSGATPTRNGPVTAASLYS